MMRDLPPDTVVDQRYSIISRIGSGGMADVYCAQDLQLGRKVALKLLYRRFAQDEEFVERFKREASSAAGLQHPHVVGVYDRGEWDGTYYIAMEFLEGRSLKQVLQEEGPLLPDRAIDVVVQILQAARFAHARGIIHRDIKPHNVILDDEGRAKVTDFGIARAGASDMTETGSIMGTAQYLSPEQAQGHAVGARSDLYAIGIVLYELLAGRVPFDGDSPVTIALKQVSELPVPPSAYNPGIPPELDAVVLHALEKDPDRRFEDADAFIAALEEVRAGLIAMPAGQATAAFGAVAAPPPTAATVVAGGAIPPVPTEDELAALAYPGEPLPPEDEEERRRRRNRWLLVLAAILLLAGAGLAFALTRPEQVKVPDVVGKDFQAARTVLINAGFKVQDQRVTDPAPRGRVLREDPQPQSQVDQGSTITLTVSDGPGSTLVPDVTNLTRARAQLVLEQQGFQVSVERESSDTIAKGRAVRTSPGAGQQIERGTTVRLFISSGPAQVTVPAVTGQNEASASAELTNLGLKPDVVQEESDQQPPGTVLRQSPSQGTKVDKGASVTIVVAKAPTKVTVPNVVGQDQGTASSTLSAASLTVVTRTQAVTDQTQDGLVISQSPAAGQRVAKGSKVTIVVGRYTAPTTPTTPAVPGQ
ncbi:MAG: eukaryotic-like serine/threonine-protein kinase [Solirubrobacteraceae bacterium]|jgi:serine/threonine-protein kinase|nr:eukaryotic-like serine/threonine-protein kinase [Solirubrobacteraceae bacterium]